MSYYYLYLQYSAIQKAVLRHDRLWSIAGMSQALARLNEVALPAIVSELDGETFVAGGGKFTARFKDEAIALQAREEISKLITTTLPFLEFQISEKPDIIPAESLADAKEPKIKEDGSVYPGIINALNEQKRCFRGYGLTFNPHFVVCEECGEYPAVEKFRLEDKSKSVCRICFEAKKTANIELKELKRKDDSSLTSIERIYKKYAEEINEDKAIPTNFEDLFPSDENSEEGKKRFAVWASDINGMGNKVTVWLNQEEDKIKDTFDAVKAVNIDIVSAALKKTFPKDKLASKPFIPFRLIVAGGDDLCVVMKAEDILEFVKNISEALDKAIKDLPAEHPLNIAWLEKNATDNEKGEGFKPHSFGGSFIVAPSHTPFKKLHHVAEALMSAAKKKTDRQGNSVNWLIMSADEKPETERLIKFEKPLFIDKESSDKLTFNEYLKLAEEHKNLSGSHTQQIVVKMIGFNNNADKLETWLKRLPASRSKDHPINKILGNDKFRDGEKLNIRRLATLLELMSI